MLTDNKWKLCPAYDLAYSYKPGSKWVNNHWMSLNGKRENFTREDLYSLEAMVPSFSRKKIDRLIDETVEHVSQWSFLAKENDVPISLSKEIASELRLKL
jgi:serine/threonine-protein kinase HipA